MRRVLTCSGDRFSELRADKMRAVAPASPRNEISQTPESQDEAQRGLTDERTSHTTASHDTETSNDSRENVQSRSND